MSVFVEKHEGKYPNYTSRMVELFRGCVLTRREHNWYDDSDFYAVVWDKFAGRLFTYEYATTRAGGTDHNYVTCDITPENLEAFKGWSFITNLVQVAQEDVYQAHQPYKDKRVRVTAKRMRKAAEGTEGTVFWTGKCRAFGSPYTPRYDNRLGFRTDTGETIWANFDQVEVIDPDQYIHDLDWLAEKARGRVGWQGHIPVPAGMIRM